MKFLVYLWFVLFSFNAWGVTPVPAVSARAWALIDPPSGRLLASGNSDVQLAPASLTLMMTAYLLFSDLQSGKLGLEDTVQVPNNALQKDGATIFLTPGEPVQVKMLLQGMLVESATDATLALVNTVSRSEAAFVSRMNEEAGRLGLTRTRFVNATGLDAPGHLSTARDMAVLARALLLKFPQYQPYFSQREFLHKGITFYSSNRLLWQESSVDGFKTGRSSKAGYCLVASALRGEQRRIAVILGAASDAKRVQGAQNLLNYGFENFDSIRPYRAAQVVKKVKLYRGVRESVNLGFGQDFYLLVSKGAASRIKAQIVTQQPIVAPVRKGQLLGRLRVSLDGVVLGEYPLLAMSDVEVAGVLGRAWDSVKLLFTK